MLFRAGISYIRSTGRPEDRPGIQPEEQPGVIHPGRGSHPEKPTPEGIPRKGSHPEKTAREPNPGGSKERSFIGLPVRLTYTPKGVPGCTTRSALSADCGE